MTVDLKRRWIEPEIFKCVVENTPLVSIDLIVRNKEGKILLGKRKNRPARGYYFVPGGRIFKNERIEEAFKNISKNELGKALDIDKAKFLGVYQHFYNDNYFGEDTGTHYVVLAYEVLEDDLNLKEDNQHADFIWLSPEEILKSENVHPYTKDYFRS